jgi:hypothetical protein
MPSPRLRRRSALTFNGSLPISAAGPAVLRGEHAKAQPHEIKTTLADMVPLIDRIDATVPRLATNTS